MRQTESERVRVCVRVRERERERDGKKEWEEISRRKVLKSLKDEEM